MVCVTRRPGPLRSMVEEIQSEESDDDDSTSEEETPIKTNPPNRDSRSVPQNTSTLCTVTLSYTEISDRNMHISDEVIISQLTCMTR